MKVSLRAFPQFPRLPRELRDEVWRHCLPYRVHELDHPVADIVFDYVTKPPEEERPCVLYWTTHTNSIPPLIARVCHESRLIAFEDGGYLVDEWHRNDHRPKEAHWHTGQDLYTAWRDYRRDSVHLNWTSSYGIQYQFSPDPDDGNSLRCLAWEALQGNGAGSMFIQYFDSYFGKEDTCPFSSTRVYPVVGEIDHVAVRNDEPLGTLSEWLVVVKVVVVHSDLEAVAGSGLFGLLGDAHVQIVDVRREDKVKKYFDLAEECERKADITIAQDFYCESASALKSRMDACIFRRFESEKVAKNMHPAIMFRLCTRKCNHKGQKCGRGDYRVRYCQCAKCHLRRNLIGLASITGTRVDLATMEALERGSIMELVADFPLTEPAF